MRVAIIIPAHNEAPLITQTLQSLANQTVLPASVVVVDDNSTDDTFTAAQAYSDILPLQLVRNKSTAENIPGTKVINAFKKGLSLLDIDHYDIICKFDADLIFPPDYLEKITSIFKKQSISNDSKGPGMVAGHCTILKNGTWEIENQNNPDHIRGALKAYHTTCFKEIGGLQSSIGWDTMDEMLARYYGWDVVTIPHLFVKHLKPTGAAYKARSMRLQGVAFYKMRYGWALTLITALKMALKAGSFSLLFQYVYGYQNAYKTGVTPIFTKDQGRFIRTYRWKGIYNKLRL